MGADILITRSEIEEALQNPISLDTVKLIERRILRSLDDAFLSHTTEKIFYKVGEKLGMQENDVLDEKFIKEFVIEFMKSDYIKNHLPRK